MIWRLKIGLQTFLIFLLPGFDLKGGGCRARALAATAGELDTFDRSTNFRQEAMKSLASGEERVVKTREDLAIENRARALAATAGELDTFDRSTAYRQEAIKSLASSEDREIKTRYDLALENRF